MMVLTFQRKMPEFQLRLFDESLHFIELVPFVLFYLDVAVSGIRASRLDAKCQQLR